MAEPGQVALGWLVVDERGAIIQSRGCVPEGVGEGDGLSCAALQLTDPTGRTLREAIGAASVEPGNQVQFTGGNWALTLIPGTRENHLLIEAATDRSSGATGARPDATFHDSPVGMYQRAWDGTFLDVNAALANLCGYDSPESMLEAACRNGTSWYVEESRLAEFFETISTRGEIRDYQTQVRRADGTCLWIAESARNVGGGNGPHSYVEGVAVDISHHKAAELELSSSREQFRRLVESVNVVPWEAEASTGRIRYVGPQAEQLLGFEVSDWLVPGFWAEHLHELDRDWVTIVREDAIRTLGRFECEYRLRDANGNVVWVRDIVSVVEDANGERTLGGFLHDITHRREAEEALRQNQDFIEQIANASPLIWYVLDIGSGRVIYLNGGGLRVLGYPMDGLLKMEPSFFVTLGHPEEIQDHERHFEQLATAEKGVCINRQFRLRTADGDWLWMRTRDTALRVGEDGKAEQVVGTAEDITVQKAAVEKLARSETLFRSLAETTNVIPFELEFTPLRFTYIGPQAASLFGYQPEEWLSDDFWTRVIHPEDRPMFELGMSGLMSNPNSDFDQEFRLSDEAGDYRWVRQVLGVDFEADNRWVGRGFILDISAAKLIEAEREESRRQLRELALQNQRAREEERLAMSRELHDELGQALTLLRIDLTWIASRISRSWADETSAALQEKLREMESDIGKTLQILRGITTRLRPPILDELGLAEAVEWQVRDFSRRVGIRCEVSAQAADDSCKTTATVVFRVLQELLTNVARHSKASRVRVFLDQLPRDLTLTVSDNGCGFEVMRAGRAAGLGLLGIRERAESLQGKLHIESRPGSGTTVVLSLPRDSGIPVDRPN